MKSGVFGSIITTVALFVVFTGATGCGGGGGGGSSPAPQNTTPTQENNPPPDNALASLAGRTLQLNSGSTTREIRFAASGSNYEEVSNGAFVQGGTYQYTKQSAPSSGILVMQEATGPVTVALTFGSSSGGNFTYTQGRTGSGTFTVQTTSTGGTTGGSTGGTSTGSTTGGTTGTSTGSTGTTGTTTGSNTGGTSGGLAFSSIAGKSMLGTRTFTSTGPTGQTHVYTFRESTFHDSDPPEEADGTYSYSATVNKAVLVLNYTSPADFNGDRHEMELNFEQTGRGTFTSQYTRHDGTVITINGNFEFP